MAERWTPKALKCQGCGRKRLTVVWRGGPTPATGTPVVACSCGTSAFQRMSGAWVWTLVSKQEAGRG